MNHPGTDRLRRAITMTALALVMAACSDDDDDPGDGGDPAEPTEFAAVVRGTLAADDVEEAQQAHDPIAEGGEAAAREAGDIAHTVLLGTTLLDSIENEFMAIDRWTDRDAMEAFYADPEVQAGLGPVFAGAPTIEFFGLAEGWETWGDMRSGEAHDPYFVHLALGELADDDPVAAQAAHDQVAAGGKQPSIDAGNVAHVVYLGLDDPQRFVAFDIWGVGEPIEPFYTNPDFRAAFEPLFSSVSEPVFESTDWYQW